LNDNVGWDPVHEACAKLEGRERWAIPWLEDDDAMWLPQFHVYRNREYMDLAEQYGCQGILGLHWRHRIMDADAGLQSRYSWDKALQPEGFFKAFAAAQVRAPREAGSLPCPQGREPSGDGFLAQFMDLDAPHGGRHPYRPGTSLLRQE
jgi:hypothetical protein